jgi:hypothetical protein
MGMTLFRDGEQYEFVIQAESLALAGSAIQSSANDRGRGALEERVAAIRRMSETVDLLFTAFLNRRLGRQWATDLSEIQAWLAKESRKSIRRAS